MDNGRTENERTDARMTTVALLCSYTVQSYAYILHSYANLSIMKYFLSFTQGEFSIYERQYYQREKEWMQKITSANQDVNCKLSTEDAVVFEQVCKHISIPDLWEDNTDYQNGERGGVHIKRKLRYKDCQHKIDILLKHIEKRIVSSHFPLRGCILPIGSYKDGSKLEPMDEVDLLFVLEKGQIEILQDGRLRWGNVECTIQEFCCYFTNCLDEFLSSDIPAECHHGGYASPKYSGVRVNGPATTLLVKLKDCNYTTSLNITPCFSKSMDSNVKSWVHGLRLKVSNRAVLTDPKVHSVTNAVENKLEISTDYIEADLLSTVQQSIIHEAYVRNKALSYIVDTMASGFYETEENKGKSEGSEVNNGNIKESRLQNNKEDTYNIETESQDGNTGENIEEHDKKNTMCNNDMPRLVDAISNPNNISKVQRLSVNKRLRYEHKQIPKQAAKKDGDLSRPYLSTNNTVSKHNLLRNPDPCDFENIKATDHGITRMFELMKDTIKTFSVAGDAHVAHPASTQSNVIKFLCRGKLVDDYHQMKCNHHKLYQIMLEHTFSKVGIKLILPYHFVLLSAFCVQPIP